MNSRIGQATKWSSIAEIVARLISPITNMVLARLLAPEAFGIVATITMIISFAEIFTDAGFQKYIIQHDFEDDKDLDNTTNVAFWTNLGLSGFICIVVFVFRHQIAELVGSPGLGNSISVASILIIIAAFSSIQTARFRRELEFKTLFFVRVVTALIPLVITIPLAVILRNYWALLIGNFAVQLANAVILSAKSKWKPKFCYSKEIFKEMFGFSAWTLLESISIWLTTNIGVFIVGSYLDEYWLGIYKTSMSTVNSYMGIITSALTPVLFSALSRYQNDDRYFRITYYQFQRLTAIFVIPMGIGLFLYQDLATRILLGDQWSDASGFIGLWGLTSALTIVFSHFSSEVFRSKGNPKISLILQISHLAFLVPTMLVSVSYDFECLYIARSLVRFQIIVFALIIMHCVYGFKFFSVMKNVFPMLISAIIMGVVGYGLQQVSTSMIWQFVAVFSCVIVYFAVLLGCFQSVRHEIFESAVCKKILKKIKR